MPGMRATFGRGEFQERVRHTESENFGKVHRHRGCQMGVERGNGPLTGDWCVAELRNDNLQEFTTVSRKFNEI